MVVLIGVFVVAYAALLLFVDHMEEWGGVPSLAALALALFGGLGWFMAAFVQRNRDLVTATEFQNALFAGAAGIGTTFCVIVKHDGSVVYYNPGFQKLFPGAIKGSMLYLDWVLERGAVPQEERDRVHVALAAESPASVDFLLNDDEHIDKRLVVKVDPLARPQGFAVVRALDPVQSGVDQEVLLGHKSARLIVQDLLNSLALGIAALSPEGVVLYANETLELALGFRKGDLVGRSLLAMAVRDGVSDYRLADYSGVASFNGASGARVSFPVTQEALREGARVIGYKLLADFPGGVRKYGDGRR